MDEEEFERLLDLFPVVRTRNYHIDLDPSRKSSSRAVKNEVDEWQDAWDDESKIETGSQAVDLNDAFWEKLRLAAEKKVGAVEAKQFCNAFQQVHKKLVSEELGLDAACRFISASKNY